MRAGLCSRCVFTQRVITSRGSVFYRCGRSEDDARFPKYPALPVVSCVGYIKRED